MTVLEDKVRYLSPAVDDEAVDVSEVVTVRRGHGARAADLHFALRHPVVAERDMRVRVDRLHPDAHPVNALVVRQRKHLFDSNIPIGIFDGELAEPQVGRLLDRLERTDLSDRAVERDGYVRCRFTVHSDDWHETRKVVPVVGLDHQMGDAPRARVDDDVRQLAKRAIGAVDGTPQLESHWRT